MTTTTISITFSTYKILSLLTQTELTAVD